MKCKLYSENRVEIGTQLKTVKITSNIFAVCFKTIMVFEEATLLTSDAIKFIPKTVVKHY